MFHIPVSVVLGNYSVKIVPVHEFYELGKNTLDDVHDFSFCGSLLHQIKSVRTIFRCNQLSLNNFKRYSQFLMGQQWMDNIYKL